MNTLLIRLCGPMQSWGTKSRFPMRDTGMEPSKSGVVGMVAASLGRPRGASLTDLTALRLGVRVLREGVMHADFQTVGGTHRPKDPYGVARFGGGAPDGGILTTRYYLADADFLVGLESPDGTFLGVLDRALRRPVWTLCLGRQAYVPSLPIPLPDSGVRPLALRDALLEYPWPEGQRRARCLYEDPDGLEQRHDQPVSFAWQATRYTMRSFTTMMEEQQ